MVGRLRRITRAGPGDYALIKKYFHCNYSHDIFAQYTGIGGGGKNISKYTILDTILETLETQGPAPPRLRNPLNLKYLSHQLVYGGRRGVYFDQEDTNYLPTGMAYFCEIYSGSTISEMGGGGGPRGRTPNHSNRSLSLPQPSLQTSQTWKCVYMTPPSSSDSFIRPNPPLQNVRSDLKLTPPSIMGSGLVHDLKHSAK